MMNDKLDHIALYIHIPFCHNICSYCDFPKVFYHEELAKKYVDALLNEINSLPNKKLKSIYFGGGTPLSLTCELLEKIILKIEEHFDLSQIKEFTVETTPEAININHLSMLKKHGVNRISIGVQTFKKLPYLNRHHTYSLIKEKVELLKSLDFNNFNFDIIYGWPNCTKDDFKYDLESIISFNPKHISIYPLAIEDNTLLAFKKIKPVSEDDYADLYELGTKFLEENGYKRYEISNFAQDGYESIHNLAYWTCADYIACGLGATSFYQGHRVKRTLSLNKYIDGKYIAEDNKEDIDEQKNDFVMLNLRLTNGFTFKSYQDKFSSDFLKDYKNNIQKVAPYITIDKERIRVKTNYLYVLNSVLVDLLK